MFQLSFGLAIVHLYCENELDLFKPVKEMSSPGCVCSEEYLNNKCIARGQKGVIILVLAPLLGAILVTYTNFYSMSLLPAEEFAEVFHTVQEDVSDQDNKCLL